MSYSKSRKHHRVAKKTIETNSAKGLFIPCQHKNKLCVLAIVVFVLVFIKGIMVGYCLSDKES